MRCVGALMGDCTILLGQGAGGLLAVVAAVLLAGDGLVQPLELLLAALEVPGIGKLGAIRERGQRLHA